MWESGLEQDIPSRFLECSSIANPDIRPVRGEGEQKENFPVGISDAARKKSNNRTKHCSKSSCTSEPKGGIPYCLNQYKMDGLVEG